MMLSSTVVLNELEIDALTEMANIGVSYAAGSLRNMVGEQVLLTVPSVAIVSRSEAARVVGERETDKLVAVHQAFVGDISGRALLIFPEANSLELVRAVTKGELPLEDIIELEQEAVAEIGNIVLNGCLASMANMLQRSLTISLPEILRGTGRDFFDASAAAGSEDAVLFLYINFIVKQRDISGYIAIIMDLPAMASLKTLIRELIERTNGEAKADVAH
jgi:chemotaxis protein CheC